VVPTAGPLLVAPGPSGARGRDSSRPCSPPLASAAGPTRTGAAGGGWGGEEACRCLPGRKAAGGAFLGRWLTREVPLWGVAEAGRVPPGPREWPRERLLCPQATGAPCPPGGMGRARCLEALND